jgi:four helix bundle protein
MAEGAVRSFRDLKVWQKSLVLSNECHAATGAFPSRASAGLLAQIERAAGSVPANIAEGAGRRTTPDYLRHLSIANGSLLELETHLIRAAGFGYVTERRLAPLVDLCIEVGRMLAGLIRALERIERDRGSPSPEQSLTLDTDTDH